MNRHPEVRSQRDQDHAQYLGTASASRSTQPSLALRGAALAFGHSIVPNQHAGTTGGNRGALAAAAAAGSASHERRTSQAINEHQTGPSVKDQIRRLERTKSFASSSLQPTSTGPESVRRSTARSPSYIAAQLASLKTTGHERKISSASTRQVEEDKNIPPPSPPIAELAAPSNGSSAVNRGTLPHIIAPKPMRVLSIGQRPIQRDAGEDRPDTNVLDANPVPQPLPGTALEAALGAFARSPSRAPSTSLQSDRSRSSSVPRPRRSLDLGPIQPEGPRLLSLAGQRLASGTSPGPRLSPTSNVLEDPMKSLPQQSLPRTVPSMSYLRMPESPPLLDQKTGLTETALADAMVASSLASSRAPSPHKQQSRPPPPPRHHSKTKSLLQRMVDIEDTRSTSPKKGLKQTLRKPARSDNEDDGKQDIRRGRRHLIRKHHRKHHEGDRKRWRDEVTQRQRKRYEGVWAANRGLYTESLKDIAVEATGRAHSDLVLNLVVRDIWKRSRLPDDVLEEVWELVDRGGIGALARDEFVVGMWLIDQRLRGRKLPMRVSYSVWASVRHSIGLQIGNAY